MDYLTDSLTLLIYKPPVVTQHEEYTIIVEFVGLNMNDYRGMSALLMNQQLKNSFTGNVSVTQSLHFTEMKNISQLFPSIKYVNPTTHQTRTALPKGNT